MITRKECRLLTELQPYEKTEASYVTNLIISSAMMGHTHLRVPIEFFIEDEVKMLREKGYEIYKTQRDQFEITWD